MRRQRLHRPGTSGLTFVEIIIALFVFVVVGSASASAYLACHQLSEYATNTMRVTSDLDDMMERIRATPFSSLQAQFPAGLANGVANSYAAIVGGYTLENEQITVTYPSQSSVRLEMLVTVNWVHRGRTRSASLSTIRTTG